MAEDFWRVRSHRAEPPFLDVAADELRVEHGCLVFVTGSVVTDAVAPGCWDSVEKIDAAEVA